ncbi:MAG: hypothetical protein Q7T55_26735, partial [Solirubrobacteraceae bacterium]|nr:hypothetical protein [Solirubrobacteraceae bacterium]
TWLREVTRVSVATPDPDDVEAGFAAPIRRLAEHVAIGETVRHAARDAVRDIETGAWSPRWVLAHNDLWMGNFLNAAPSSRERYVVIDWGGSELRGHAIYDLVRVAMSLRVSKRRFAAEVQAHCGTLGCQPAQAQHHLIGALARLGENLGEWPEAKFVELANLTLDYLGAVR